MDRNIYYRACDTFTHPQDFPRKACIAGIRTLLHTKTARQYLHNLCPSRDQLQERLQQILNECILNSEYVHYNEIYDIAIQHNMTLAQLEINPQHLEQPQHRAKPKKPLTLALIAGDKQNVHNTYINKNVKRVAKQLVHDFPAVRTYTNPLLNIATNKNELKIIKNIIKSTVTFGIDITLLQLLQAVYLWIQSQAKDIRPELFTRLREEINDMTNVCSTGHMARLVNVVQGFCDQQYDLSQYKDIYVNIKHALNEFIQTVSPEDLLDKTDIFIESRTTFLTKRLTEWRVSYPDEYEQIKTYVKNYFDDPTCLDSIEGL